MEVTEEPEEKVICEVPVYLSKSLAQQLYLVQYPQRPATVALQQSDVLEVKMKPSLDKLQLTVGVDTEGPYYDPFHGEILAEAAEGLGLDEDQYIPDARRRIEKTILESSNNPKIANSSRYVAGIIKDGAVHLTRLKSIVQMKPTLPFLNKAEKAKAKYEGAGADTEDEAEEEAQKVTVKFKRNPMDPNNPTTSKSSFVARKKEEEEPWLVLDYQDKTKAIYEQLCTPNLENDVPMYILTQKDYLAKLFPKHKETVIDGSDKIPKGQMTNQRISSQIMKEMTLPEQLRILLLNGKVMRYDQIVEFLKTRLHATPDETTLLRTVQTVAVLVQGCWVARSELVYPDAFKSNANGVCGTIMQAARDTVLSFFTEQRFVERLKLAPMLHIPDEELTEILSNVAHRVIKKGWEFYLPNDHSFMARFPDVVQRQNMIWEVKHQHRNRKVSESAAAAAKDGLKPPSRSPPRRRHSRTMSYSSDNESGTETENRGRRASGGASGRQRRPSSRSSSESSLLGVPSKAES